MADTSLKSKVPVPLWTIITFVLSVLIGSAGWINAALQAQAEGSRVQSNGDIRMLQNENDRQNEIIVANTTALADIKANVTDRLARIETLLAQIEKRVR